ncbi:MAG TPA: DUF4375 domain-containing protein [Armatimonadota bacterium]|nr:DUF4375 domain-containing protein [Armatimonadota bacterium]
MESAESKLVSRVADGFAERAEKEGLKSLTPEEQTVLLPLWASGIIDNGGFKYFYEGATETLEVAAAFDSIGLPEAADACRKAHSLVPAEVLAGGYMACRDWMDTFEWEELDALFLPLNHVIWDLDDRLVPALAVYIRAHGLAPGS